jgi:PAS domain S-box-containing protein
VIDWKRVVDGLPAGVAIFDDKGRIVYVNGRISDRTGIEDEQVKKNPLSLIHPEDVDKAIKTIDAALRGETNKEEYPLLVRAVKKGGGYQWIEVRFKEMESDGRRYFVAVFTDVSERIRLQKKIESLLDYLKFLNKMLRHDILNVFTRVYTYAELLEEKHDAGLIQKIKESVESGVRIIKKVGELESSAEEDKKRFRIGEVVREVAKGYNVRVEVKGDAEIMANDGIYSVFENLIGNSVKHGKASRIEIEVQKGENGVCIRVADDGVGIPPHITDKIFEEGFTTGPGNGLGLYIVRKLVESFGGSIKVEKSVPKGTVFVIEIPQT